MDLKSSHASTVLTDPVPVNKSRLRMHSSLLGYSQQDSPHSPGKCSRSNSRKSVDDVRSNGWLDAMKASSPPRKKLLKGSSAQVASIDYDIEDYYSWMVSSLYLVSSFNFFGWIITSFVVVSHSLILQTNAADKATAVAVANTPKNP